MQYPHTLIATVVTGGSYPNGEAVAGTTSTVQMDCRLSARAGTATVQNVDGKSVKYNYIVYLPLPVTKLEVGTKVDIQKDGVTIVKDTVKLFHEGFFNARIWL